MAESLGRRDGKGQRRTAPPLITRSAKRGKWASFNRERSEHLAPPPHRRRLRRSHRSHRMVGQRAAAANERSANGRRRHIPERFALSSGMKVARRSTASHSKQRGNVAGYAYRPAARIVWAVSRPLASAASTVPISRPAYSASPEKNTVPPSGFRSADCASRVLGVA